MVRQAHHDKLTMTVTCHPELVEDGSLSKGEPAEGGQYFCSSINIKLAGQGLPARREIKTKLKD